MAELAVASGFRRLGDCVGGGVGSCVGGGLGDLVCGGVGGGVAWGWRRQ